jgi:hypothetical protein
MGGINNIDRRYPGYPTITCTIYYINIKHALCDLGASVNLMSNAIFKQLGYTALSPTTLTVQLADSSIRYPEGVVESLLVQTRTLMPLKILWSFIWKMRVECCSFSGNHSSMMLEIESMWDPE